MYISQAQMQSISKDTDPYSVSVSAPTKNLTMHSTCCSVFYLCPSKNSRSNGYDLNNKSTTFSTVPFFKDHLKQQIEAAGGTVYSNFENVPANKYRSCFLLAPFPCITAKYVQCLAANITVSIRFSLVFFSLFLTHEKQKRRSIASKLFNCIIIYI